MPTEAKELYQLLQVLIQDQLLQEQLPVLPQTPEQPEEVTHLQPIIQVQQEQVITEIQVIQELQLLHLIPEVVIQIREQAAQVQVPLILLQAGIQTHQEVLHRALLIHLLDQAVPTEPLTLLPAHPAQGAVALEVVQEVHTPLHDHPVQAAVVTEVVVPVPDQVREAVTVAVVQEVPVADHPVEVPEVQEVDLVEAEDQAEDQDKT